MKKKVFAVVCCMSLLLAAGACKKKEEQPVPQSGIPGQPGMPPQGMPQGMPPQGMPPQGMPPQGMPPQGMPQGAPQVMMPQGETNIVVPPAVKGKWKAVILVVQNKETQKTSEYTVNLNSDFKVPGTDLKIAVGDYLPDFKMQGLTITSLSNDPNNPAVGIKVFEGGRQIFPAPGKKWGWLYTKFPTMHPFEHPKYAIVLKDGIRKG